MAPIAFNDQKHVCGRGDTHTHTHLLGHTHTHARTHTHTHTHTSRRKHRKTNLQDKHGQTKTNPMYTDKQKKYTRTHKTTYKYTQTYIFRKNRTNKYIRMKAKNMDQRNNRKIHAHTHSHTHTCKHTNMVRHRQTYRKTDRHILTHKYGKIGKTTLHIQTQTKRCVWGGVQLLWIVNF